MPADKQGPFPRRSRHRVDENLRRVMARQGLTIKQVVRRTGLDDRTVKAMLRDDGAARPQARTLHRLAEGLGVPVDELFQNPALLARRLFDRRTNPVVDEVAKANPQLFDGWTRDDFDDLYSRFGTGGQLTTEGTLAAVKVINHRRELFTKVALLLETGQAPVLTGVVDLLYEQVVLRSADQSAGASASGPEDAVLHVDHAPDAAARLGDERADDRLRLYVERSEVPADVARHEEPAR
jgi:transcriptional regulator with XRE-family HTH domain